MCKLKKEKSSQGSHSCGKPGKVMEYHNLIFKAWKSHEISKKKSHWILLFVLNVAEIVTVSLQG